MTNELRPDGDLQPDLADLAFEEAGSEDVSHLLPAVREMPEDLAFLPGAYYAISLEGIPAGTAPRTLGSVLGKELFASLSDIRVFGRNAATEPLLEVGPDHNEPAELMVGMELFPDTGTPPEESDFGMFDMVAGRISKKLGRAKKPAAEPVSGAVTRGMKLAGLKGKFGQVQRLFLRGSFAAPAITDAALSIGLKRDGGGFAWSGGRAQPLFKVRAEGLQLAPNAAGNASAIEFSFMPARVPQPKKVLERMATCANYFIKRIGGQLTDAAGKPANPAIMQGEDPELAKAVAAVTAAGLRPGHPVTVRLAQ
ncbi:MAG: hypothetical protein IT462_10170 [Planctomycetes bacterium]|nr:hypothetical protein [Planctomycetota bacterium]